MLLKQTMSSLLVLSLLIPASLPATALAQTQSTAPGDDAIELIVQAMSASSAVESRNLLAKAQAKAAAEKLPADTLESINASIARATRRISEMHSLTASAPSGFSIDKQVGAVPPKPAPSQTTKDQAAAIAAMIAKNPDLYQTMREIGIGRLERDSSNLEAIVKDSTGQNLKDRDQQNAVTQQVLATAGAWLKTLRDAGIIEDWSATNKALRASHPSLSIDTLASQIIREAAERNFLYSAGRRLSRIPGLPQKMKETFGVGIEVVASYAVNANLIMRLQDLYGINMSNAQQNLSILMMASVAKAMVLNPMERVILHKTAAKLGEKAAQAKMSADGMSRMAKAIFSSKMMIGLAEEVQRRESAVAALESAKAEAPAAAVAEAKAVTVTATATVAGEATAATAEAGSAAASAAKPVAATVTAVEGAAGKIVDAFAAMKNVTSGAANAAGDARAAGKITSFWQVAGASAILLGGMLRSGIETEAAGQVAMWWFQSQKEKSRAIETSDFHAYLMELEGKGFFKLLIATMNHGVPSSPVMDLRQSNDPRAKFILNIARSVKICSPSDKARYKALTANGVAARVMQSKDISDLDYRVLRFACEDNNLGSGRYAQIIKEAMTFNAIPEWEVATLRGASYSTRIQMGELLMQLQFLMGEPEDSQIEFFNKVISKILGLDRVEDSKYFSRFYGFIRERGGMHADVSSPTGFSIKPSGTDDPYAASVNYTITGAPDMPSAPPPAK